MDITTIWGDIVQPWDFERRWGMLCMVSAGYHRDGVSQSLFDCRAIQSAYKAQSEQSVQQVAFT